MTSYTNLLQNISFGSLNDIFKSANTTTEGMFWTAMYWMFMVIVLISSLSFGFEVAVLMAFFSGLILGLFFLYLGWINILAFGMSEAILLFFVIYLMYSSNKNQ